MRLDDLHPEFRTKIQQLLTVLGPEWRVTSGYRSVQDQDKLYAQGRTTPGNIVTNAKGGQSFHNFGLACDLVRVVNGKCDWDHSSFVVLGREAKKLGLEWGGDWRFLDLPHVQAPNLNLKTVQTTYTNRGMAGIFETKLWP